MENGKWDAENRFHSPFSIFHFPFSILLLTLPAWLPLLLDPGLINTRAGGDSPFLLQRVHQMSVALRGGHFPARWMPDAAFGLGYPFWNYYAPLAFYIAAGFHLAGLGLVNAIKLTQTLGFVGAGAGMYLLAEDIFDSRPAALLAAAAYTYAPFHLVNVYVRGDSLGEFIAFAFYPLIVLGLRRLRAQPGPGPAAFTAVAYAGLILTHNISALIFTPFAIAYALFLHTSRIPHPASRIPHPASRNLLWAGIALALGLALSAWYWTPALLEQEAVQLEGNLTGYFHYAGHFRRENLVQPDLLFNFDVDAAGTPFAMGLVQAILGMAGLLALVMKYVLRKTRYAIRDTRYAIRDTQFFAGTALVATFLITPWSRLVWDHVPLLPFVQFPWRWLSLQAFGLSVVIGGLIGFRISDFGFPIRNPKSEIRLRWGIAVGLSLALIITSMLRLRVEYLPVRNADVTAERLMLYEMFTGNIGSTVRAEYLPAAVNPRPWTSDRLEQDAQSLPLGATSAQLMYRGPASQAWQVTVDQPQDVVFPTYWFPGWRATIDGQPASTSAQPNHGGVRVTIPGGTHQVNLTLERTPARRLAELISTAAFLMVLVLVARRGVSLRDLRRGAAMTGVGVTAGLVIITTSAVARPIEGPLSMDFSRMPYLHPNPGGIHFAGGPELLSYSLTTTEVDAGQAFGIEMVWNELLPGTEVEIALVSPAEVLFDVPAVVAQARASIENKTVVRLHVPTDTAAGVYLPRLRLVSGRETLPARVSEDDEVEVLYLQYIRIRPTIAIPGQMVGRFANLAGLESVEAKLIAPERLEVRMTWWADQMIPANYATSVRLKQVTGEMVAQVDTQPCYGFCPTSLWEPGVPVYDRRWLDLPAGTPPSGETYNLEIVLYERVSLAAVGTIQINNILR